MTVEIVSSRRRKTEAFLDIHPRNADWLVKGALPKEGVGFLAGATMAGKTFLALDISLRLAASAKVFGRKAEQVGVVYIASEDADGCRRRIAAWRRQFRRDKWTPFHLLDPSSLDYGDLDLTSQASVNELLVDLQESAEAFQGEGLRLGLVVIDTLSCCLPGVEENSSEGMSRALTVMKRIASVTGALVLAVAHYGKAGEERGIRGWSGLNSNSNATLLVSCDEEDPDLRIIKLHKVKNGIAGQTLGFRLQTASVGIVDEDGDDVESCVCIYESSLPSGRGAKRRKAMSVPEELVFAAIRQLTDHGRTQPPPPVPGVKPWQKAISRPDLRMKLWSQNFPYDGEPDNSAGKRLSRALQGLSSQQRIRMEGDAIWLV